MNNNLKDNDTWVILKLHMVGLLVFLFYISMQIIFLAYGDINLPFFIFGVSYFGYLFCFAKMIQKIEGVF